MDVEIRIWCLWCWTLLNFHQCSAEKTSEICRLYESYTRRVGVFDHPLASTLDFSVLTQGPTDDVSHSSSFSFQHWTLECLGLDFGMCGLLLIPKTGSLKFLLQTGRLQVLEFGVCDLKTFNPKMGTCAGTACLLYYIEISPMLGCLPVSLGFVPEAWTASSLPLTCLKSQSGQCLHKYTYSIHS